MSPSYKVHARHPDDKAKALCGLDIEQGQDSYLPLAPRPDNITCQNCLTKYYKDANP